MTDQPILTVEDLAKTFKVGFTRKVVDAVRGISLSVAPGEIFGFLGPNGAGKTTSIKMCMDLIRPTGGSIRMFGLPPGTRKARAKVGYLPEQPYFYDYLKPGEIIDFFGRLYGLKRKDRRRRTEELIDLVGLTHARNRTLRKFSKGMLQRLGLAQALVSDPELVILDEPLSGLDPIGRKELKDIIASLKKKGTTVFFSSHILADIELLCDRIAIIDKGKLKYLGPTRDFVQRGRKEVEVVVSGISDEAVAALEKDLLSVERFGATLKMLCSVGNSAGVVRNLVEAGGMVESVVPRSESLEDIFVRIAGPSGGTP